MTQQSDPLTLLDAQQGVTPHVPDAHGDLLHVRLAPETAEALFLAGVIDWLTFVRVAPPVEPPASRAGLSPYLLLGCKPLRGAP